MTIAVAEQPDKLLENGSNKLTNGTVFNRVRHEFPYAFFNSGFDIPRDVPAMDQVLAMLNRNIAQLQIGDRTTESDIGAFCRTQALRTTIQIRDFILEAKAAC